MPPPDLIDVHTAFLEKHPLERGLDEAQRALATLATLLAACPGDLQPIFQVRRLVAGVFACDCIGDVTTHRGSCARSSAASEMHRCLLSAVPALLQADLVDFFAELAGRLETLSQKSPRQAGGACCSATMGAQQARRIATAAACCTTCGLQLFAQTATAVPSPPSAPCSTSARLLPPTLTAVSTFLLGNGRDCAAAAAGLHSALHALALGGLGAKDGRLREAAATYLRCQMQLGSLPAGSAQLQDVQDWVERELEAPALKWWAGRSGWWWLC